MKRSFHQLPAWPQFDRKTERKVIEILRSGKVNYWTGGEGLAFEREFAAWIGARDAVSVSNGTAALHLALKALGIGPGDEVVCTPYSFRASATCVVNAGAKPVFADVGTDHMLNAATIERALTKRTKAVIVVHLYGQVADLGPILRLARRRGLKVVEDCAQCLGGRYRGKPVGTLGDVGCFSFCQSKHFTTAGEGGMVVAKNASVLRTVRSLRDHGWIVGSTPKAYDGVGYNFRMTEIQSAVGRGELARFETWNLPRRHRLAAALIKGLKGHPLVAIPPVDTDVRAASFWLVPFVLDAKKLRCSVAAFIEAVQAKGAGAYRILWPLMDPQPVAGDLIERTIGFWVHPTYSLREIRLAIRAFNEVADKMMR